MNRYDINESGTTIFLYSSPKVPKEVKFGYKIGNTKGQPKAALFCRKTSNIARFSSICQSVTFLKEIVTRHGRVLHITVYEVPVYNIPEVSNISRTCIALINVIGMLPDINSQNRCLASSQRAASSCCVNDFN